MFRFLKVAGVSTTLGLSSYFIALVLQVNRSTTGKQILAMALSRVGQKPCDYFLTLRGYVFKKWRRF